MEFLKAALRRAARTMAQTAVAMIPAAVAISDVDWQAVAGTALLAGLVSMLNSVATGLPEVGYDCEDDEDEPRHMAGGE